MCRVVYTRLLLWAYGMAITPNLVLIQPHRRGDESLLAHEFMHCEQMRVIGTLRFWWRYVTSRQFRLDMEVQAYRVAATLRPDAIDRYAWTLAKKYLLKITVDDARRLLTA